jgi:XRE family transcriptional regulator, regulator of sulfur utilization
VITFPFATVALRGDSVNSELMKIIGDRLRNVRKERGLSQEELADRAGLHFTFVGKVERGEQNATLETIEKMTSSLGISLEQLFRYIDPATEETDNYILMQIINKLQGRSIEEQRKVLKTIELWLE